MIERYLRINEMPVNNSTEAAATNVPDQLLADTAKARPSTERMHLLTAAEVIDWRALSRAMSPIIRNPGML